MDEIKTAHDLGIEWGCITNLLDRIMLLEEKIDGGWPALIDMVTDAMTEAGALKDPAKVFTCLYAFLFRLYYRIKTDPTPAAFNQYSHVKDQFWVENYDYAVFKWATEHGFTKEIDNKVIKINESDLKPEQVKAFIVRCS